MVEHSEYLHSDWGDTPERKVEDADEDACLAIILEEILACIDENGVRKHEPEEKHFNRRRCYIEIGKGETGENSWYTVSYNVDYVVRNPVRELRTA